MSRKANYNSKTYSMFELVLDPYAYEHSVYAKNRICVVNGCGQPGHDRGGSRGQRSLCKNHHYESIAVRKGMSKIKLINSWHPYRKYRKNFCENIDGRLGYKCTATIVWEGQLQVDHINGVPNDNRPENLQTLCACCHVYKSNINEDYASPGRKTLRG